STTVTLLPVVRRDRRTRRGQWVGLAIPRRRRAAGWVRTRQKPSVEDMTTIAVTTDPRTEKRGWLAQLGVDSAYPLVGLPMAIVAFTLIITGLSLGAGLFITVLGLPVVVGTLFVARGLAQMERVRIRPVLRRPLTPIAYRRPDP